MDFYTYFFFVTALSVIYAASVRIVQSKLMDPKISKDIQEQSKRINELYKEASKNNDKRKMDEISKMNEEMMPRMNAMLMGQMKMMVVLLAVFFAFSYVCGYFDPNPQDDFSMNLTAIGNGSYSGSFVLAANASPSFWYATLTAHNNGSETAMNQTVFFVGPQTEELLWNQSKDAPMQVGTDKANYSPGQTVTLYASAPAGSNGVSAALDSGTRFYVDLPVTIPLINLRRIYDSRSWFIFSAVIIGLFLNPIVSLMEKHLSKKTTEKV